MALTKSSAPRPRSLPAALPTASEPVQEAPAERSPRGRKKGLGPQHHDKRAQILAAAALLFATNGFEATSLDMLADQMGMHKATLYHYFRSKDEVLYQILVKSFENIDEVIAQTHDASLPVVERFRLFVHALAHAQNNVFGRCLVLVGARPLELGSVTDIRRFQKKLETTVLELVREGIERGDLRECDPKLVSAMLFGALNWVPHWYRPEGRLPLDGIVDHFFDMLLRGIAA
jgi:AcrR family transcriptional regulator